MEPKINMRELVLAAVGASSNKQQSQAEATLMKRLMASPSQFFFSCLELASDVNSDDNTRQSALVVFSRTVTFFDNNLQPPNNNNQTRLLCWDRLDNMSKQAVRQKLIALLVGWSDTTETAAANSISAIANIEVVRGDWPTLIPSLVNNTDNAEPQIQKTAIRTLGFICQKLKSNSLAPTLPYDTQSSILAGILNGINKRENIPVMEAAVAALRDCLPFLQPVMADQRIRSHIAQVILSLIQNPSHAYLDRAIQALTEFCKSNYDLIGNYIQDFAKSLDPVINAHHEGLTPVALDFWDTLGQFYLERLQDSKKTVSSGESFTVKNHLLCVQDLLIKSALLCLLETDLSISNIREGGAKLVSTLVETCGFIVIDPITAFVSNCIVNSDWKYRQASATAFGCLCFSPEKQAIGKLFQAGLDSMIQLLKDSHSVVVLHASQAFSELLEVFSDVFLDHLNYKNNVKILIQGLTNRDSQVVESVAKCFSSLCYAISNKSSKSHLFAGWNELLNTLFEFLFYTEYSNIISIVCICLNYLFKCCHSPQVARQYIQELLKRYARLPKNKRSMGPKDTALMEGILIVMGSALVALRQAVVRDQFVREIFNFVLEHFKNIGDIDEGGMYLIGGLALVARKGFAKYLQEFWPYLDAGLAQTSNKQTFTATLSCLGDISRVLDYEFHEYVEQVMRILLGYLADAENIGRESRLWIIKAITDTIYACTTPQIKSYLNNLLTIIDIAFQGVMTLLNTNMEDFEYAEELRVAVLELYQTVSYKCHGQTPDEKICQHYPKLEMFIFQSCNPKFRPTVEYVGQCVQLLTDMGFMLRIQAHLRSSEEYRKLVETLKKYQRNNPQLHDIVDHGMALLHTI